MKRILPFLSAALAFGLLAVSPAFAAGPELTVASAAAEAGQSVTLDVSFSGNPGVAGWSAQVVYDEDVLALDSMSGGSAFRSLSTVGEPATGKVLGFTSGESVSGDGVLFSISFTVKDDAPAGRSVVTLSEATFSDDGFAEYDVSVLPGTVTVVRSGLPEETAAPGDGETDAPDTTAGLDDGEMAFEAEKTVPAGEVWTVEGTNAVFSLTVAEGGAVRAAEIYVDCAFGEDGTLDPSTGTPVDTLEAGSYEYVVLIGGVQPQPDAAATPEEPAAQPAAAERPAAPEKSGGIGAVPVIVAVAAAVVIALIFFLPKKKKAPDDPEK